MTKLYRSKKDSIIAGVLGGFAEAMHVDSTVVRLAYVFLTIFTGLVPLVLFYIVAAIIIPEEPTSPEPPKHTDATVS